VGILGTMKRVLIPSALGLAALAILLAIMFSTNPEQAPPYVAIAIFIALYGVLAVICYACLAVLRFLGMFQWSDRRLRSSASVAAILPVALLLLQSIGQLTLRDVALLLVFIGLIALYVHRNRRASKRP
jgi:hypothetical protein